MTWCVTSGMQYVNTCQQLISRHECVCQAGRPQASQPCKHKDAINSMCTRCCDTAIAVMSHHTVAAVAELPTIVPAGCDGDALGEPPSAVQ